MRTRVRQKKSAPASQSHIHTSSILIRLSAAAAAGRVAGRCTSSLCPGNPIHRVIVDVSSLPELWWKCILQARSMRTDATLRCDNLEELSLIIQLWSWKTKVSVREGERPEGYTKRVFFFSSFVRLWATAARGLKSIRSLASQRRRPFSSAVHSRSFFSLLSRDTLRMTFYTAGQLWVFSRFFPVSIFLFAACAPGQRAFPLGL